MLPLGALAVIGGILMSSGNLAAWTARHGSCNIISENVNCNCVERFSSMAGADYRLLIGNKAWSSWSLRPWLLMRRFGVPFEEINVRLRQPDSRAQILAHSPAGMVPALIAGDLVVWDSLAIIEFVQDRHPDLAIWPKDGIARAVARSVSAEMHSGFQPLRETCAMNLFARTPLAEVPRPVEANIRRIVTLWRDCRSRSAARAHSCSRISRLRTPCTPPSPRASGPMPRISPGSATMARRKPMSRPSSPCPRWRSGRRERSTKQRPRSSGLLLNPPLQLSLSLICWLSLS